MDNKLGLDEREYAFFTAQIIAGGDWHLIKSDAERAFELLRMFVEALVPVDIEPELYANSIYNIVQNSLLAARGYSFETLQKLPAFSEFGKKNLIQLLKFRREKGDAAFENAFRRMFREGWRQRKPQREIITVLSGDGRSIETPVKFSIAESTRRIRAEYWFVTYNYGKEGKAWERGIHFSLPQPQTRKPISHWNITLEDGRTSDIYFDADPD